MYKGTAYNIPSLKLDAKVNCADCHRKESQSIGVATREGCVLCHETGDYAAVMDAWQDKTRQTLSRLKELDERVATLLVTANDLTVQQLYETAQKDSAAVQADGSLGVHNPELTDVQLQNAQARLQRCLEMLLPTVNEE